MRPKQKVSEKHKINNVDNWQENTVDYYADLATDHDKRKSYMRVLYRLAAGHLEERDYTYFTQPFRDRPELNEYQTRLRNYDILSPNLGLLMGEKLEQSSIPEVFRRDSPVEDERKKYIEDEWERSVMLAFANEVRRQLGKNPEYKPKPREDIEKEAMGIRDTLAEKAKIMLEHISQENEVLQKMRQGFYDWIATAMVITMKDAFREGVDYDIISPLDAKFVASSNTQFIEDSEAAGAEKYFTLSELIDSFGEEFTDKEIEELETRYGGEGNSNDADYVGVLQSSTDELFSNIFGAIDRRYPEDHKGIKVEYICWRSFKKVGKLLQYDIDGSEYYVEVNEEYIPAPYDEIEWMWVTDIWEGYRIDEKYYKLIQPIPFRRGSIENPGGGKLPINGRIYYTRHAEPVSVVEKGRPYQELYNTVKWRHELMMHKNKDSLIMMPLGLIPEGGKYNLDMFSFMYYADATGFAFVDETDSRSIAALQQVKSINASISEYIRYIYEILQAIKAEWDDMLGLSPQRKGQEITPSSGKATTQTAVYKSTVMTAELFAQYEELEMRDFEGLLELGRYAYPEGLKQSFIEPNGNLRSLDISADEISMLNTGVYLTNRAEEINRLNELRAMAQSFAQNGAGPATTARIIDAKSFSTIMKELQDMENRIEEEKRREEQLKGEEIAQKERAERRKEELEKWKTQIESATDIYEAQISAGEGSKGFDAARDEFDKQMERQIEEKKIASNERIANAKTEAEKYKADKDLQIAKENKNKYDV